MKHQKIQDLKVMIMTKTKLALRISWGVLSWVLFECLVNIPCILLGWVLVPVMAAFKQYKHQTSFKLFDGTVVEHSKSTIHWKHRWMYIWDNYEDGIDCDTYYKSNSTFKRIVAWSANRNPANNLRTVPVLSCNVHPDQVRFIGSKMNWTNVGTKEFTWLHHPGNILTARFKKFVLDYDTNIPMWYFCWMGAYSNFRIQFKFRGDLYRFWVGWKLYPDDIYQTEFGYRKYGAGFATQFKRLTIKEPK